MYQYIVSKNDGTPLDVARKLGISYQAMMDANRGRRDLRQVIAGRDMQSDRMVTTFMAADWREGARVNLPSSYHPGMMGASGTDDADVSQGDAGPSKTSCTLSDTCNPASDCWDEDQCKAQGGQIGSNICKNYTMVLQVQKNLNAAGFGPIAEDGAWGPKSQCALNKSGQDFQTMLGQQCQGAAPTAVCGAGSQPVPAKKKKEGEACSDSAECEAPLVCQGGKCAKPEEDKPTKKSSSFWPYLGIGLAAVAVVFGAAYVSQDDKDKKDQEKRRQAA